MTDIRYVADSFVWSVSTLLMCMMGQCVHWLSSYGRARQVSKNLKTQVPSVWLYWYGDWPTTLASFLLVFCGYFFLPEMAARWPDVGRLFGLVDDAGHPVGLSMFASFLWGLGGNMLADFHGRRLTRMVE